MARKWQKVASFKRKISSPRADEHSDFNACSTSVAEKGHFNVYTSEGKRFMVPVAYLNNAVFKELLKISEEEFGLPGDGPITLPCDTCTSSSVAEKGHFNVYTLEGKRFMVPLAYLDNNIFKELLRISEEEFGLPCGGPITLPCDAASMDYVLSLLRRGVSKEMEMALLSSIFISCQSTCSILPVEQCQQIAVCSF
ncbi:hypothetical protein J5N97_029133 [Dioscorea zingiberensis]|uniref:Uncharacterized protein n=1 Tax=Dioscorea zingiberensis TaxID=325984 RepID=A0A9D5BZP9_9LILI|nr:hypothetical protein J5N97_029133 [Dioscorea zingiberensis]